MLGPVALRRLRVLVAILGHGGHIVWSARRMDWGGSRAATGVRSVLMKTLFLLLSSRASRPAAHEHAGICRAGIWGAGGALGAAHLGSAGLCRHQHHAPAQFVTHELMSSVSTWRAEMATWPGWDGRFTPFLRMWPRALVPVHASWTRQPGPTLSADLVACVAKPPLNRLYTYVYKHGLGVIPQKTATPIV